MDRLLVIITLSVCLLCFCASDDRSDINENHSATQISLGAIERRGKKTGHYFLHSYHGWYALSWIYWIKVKLIVVAFFVGTAFIWVINYIGKFYNNCPNFDHTHYGHYRSVDDPTMAQFLQNLHERVYVKKPLLSDR